MGKILVVDDQRNMRTTLAMMLRGSGYDVDEAEEGKQGCELGSTGAYDVVLTDLRMGETDGIDVLRQIKREQPITEVIVMTAYGTIESAVEAMRLGAFDYIQKPFTEQELQVKVQKALESRRLHGQVQLLAQEFRDKYHFENIIGRSQAVRDVLGRVVKIAPTDATVLITGESGTGKEQVARAIHANSRRADKPFVMVNCAAITETLLESELFGHARGAFTGAMTARRGLFEEADGGTFFFDEIAETTQTFQAKLLRAIQDGEVRRIGENRAVRVDVRVMAATNVDLAQAVEEKTFRKDLYYRLNVARFHLPPLRERREDIPLLVEFFLEKYNRKMKTRTKLGDGVMERLQQYEYPGNVRELENMVEQAVALAAGGLITLDDILPEAPRTPATTTGKTLADLVDAAERAAVEGALRTSEGNRERAAEILGISSTTLWRKMTRLGVSYDARSQSS
ncbi:MAG: sigma-54-dependent Fis family transcriptional regulator [Polyangiaceae bacterium]|nr:sigma-54-dependent Fis family transcriptional regulator [Polyangiaceae bacterium]MCW5790885.1 sigma-54-dependent Fis family transcriptional regulator [Polyangiaceae bacterium]